MISFGLAGYVYDDEHHQHESNTTLLHDEPLASSQQPSLSGQQNTEQADSASELHDINEQKKDA